eukprot:m.35202 g.35202  ORF g.35202 m.35202 type:complete len:236 (+) comp11113_c0_seq2:143-850(+)
MLRSALSTLGRFLQPRPLERSKPFALFTFTSEADVKQWVCTSDREAFGGHSVASLDLMPEGFVRFQGQLSTKLPSNDKVIRSGFCLMRSRVQKPTLLGQTYIDLQTHNALEFDIRGDGRAYIANLQPNSYRDEDLYQATIYTRGGPHWQTVQIPLTEFLLTHRGYVQNEQAVVNPQRIKTVGILLADKRDGPFQLDIRQIRAVTMVDTKARMDTTNARMKTEWKATNSESTETSK